MDVSKLKDNLWELYYYRSSFWVKDVQYFRNPHSNILWKFSPIFTECETYGKDHAYEAYITEACGICIGTQAKGPNPGLQGIAKIRMQTPNNPQNPSATKPQRVSSRLGFEYYNLFTLTERGSTCTPRLLDYVLLTQNKQDPVPGGFFFFLVMERLPGRNLVNFADLPMSERDQVRLAFAKTIREFNALKFVHNDTDRRNLMWDSENKKCYIIDLEDAYILDDKAKTPKFIPERTYRHWGIAGTQINCHGYGLDPMVPCDGGFIEDPDDETLEKMAAEAVGKDFVFGK